MKIAIIGAGPVGCYAGYLLAKAGNEVDIFENHPQVGLPIQCTGLLTSDFDQFNLPLDSFLVNTFHRVKIYAPKEDFDFSQKEYLVCRRRFDNFFADLALKAGAKIYLNYTFIRRGDNKNNDPARKASLVILNQKEKKEITITPDLVIGADGPLSPTAKAFGLYHPQRENYYGIQAVVEGKFDADSFQAYFGKQVCPDLFAWVVPETLNLARIGVAMRSHSQKYFQDFMEKNGFKAREMQAGAIPIYHPKQALRKENCYLLGDAAGFVKATTLGGLVPGLEQAKILADCLINDKDYEKEIKPLARKLKLHLKLKKILDQLSDDDWDRLVRYLKQEKISKVLSQHTRDDPFPLIIKALLKEPKFLYFAKYLF